MPFLFGIVVFVVLAAVWTRIFRRLGWSPWYAVLMLIPLAFLIASVVVAFQKWPIERRVEDLEREVAKRS